MGAGHGLTNYDEGMAMGVSAEPRDASAGREKAVALLSAAVLGGLLAGGGRTGAAGWAHRVQLYGRSLC